MRILAGLILVVVTACGGGSSAGDDDDVEQQVCNDDRYGDGVCNLELSCAAPDIDCFTFARSQSDAEDIFAGFEAQIAAQQGRAPRRIVPDTDPRWRAMRQALDAGWDAYRKTIPVADLGDHEPALVVVNDPEINAFVFGDIAQGKVNFIVVVHSGTLDQEPSEDALAGLVMHELTHAVGLHVVPGGDALFRRYYIAADGREPLGFAQGEDAIAREHGDAWRLAATDAGPFVAPELGGVPFSGNAELLLSFGLQQLGNSAQCTAALGALVELRNDIINGIDFLDTSFEAPFDITRDRADGVIADLADCVAATGDTSDAFDVVAAFLGASAAQVRAQSSDEEIALLDGKPFVVGFADLVIARREEMRAIEQAFEEDTGEPFAALRYFSTEENADDVTVPVLARMGLEEIGAAEFLFGVLDPGSQARCQELLEAGVTPPYGADLSDEHHATCWRVDHIVQVANSGVFPDPGVREDRARRTQRAIGERKPLIPRLPIAY